MKYLIIIVSISLSIISQAQPKITLEDIWTKGTFSGESVAGFMGTADGKSYLQQEYNGIYKYDFENGRQKAKLLDSNDLVYAGKKIRIEEFKISDDETKVLIKTASEFIYRRSAFYDVYLIDLSTKKINKISDKKIMHATLSPKNDKVAYVANNNLFVYDVKSQLSTAITKDGKFNEIINGNCDWVYEEEFGFTKAYEWSPTGQHLAYYKFDESNVKEYAFAKYSSLYPTQYTYKYPKAGEDNSKISIWLADINSNKSSKVDIGNEDDIYVPRIRWNSFSNQLYIYKLNRLQNKYTVFSHIPGDAESNLIYNEDNASYVEVDDDIYFFKKQNLFLYTSEKSGFKQIWVHDNSNQSDANITNTSFDIVSLVGVDEAKKIIYYTAASIPTELKLYSMRYDGTNKTCLTPEAGVHNITMAAGNKYFLDAFSKLNTPPVFSLKDVKGKTLRVIKENKKLNAAITTFQPVPQELIKVPNQNGDSLNAWILLPKNINDGKQHPMLMFQYSGPGSQQVTNSWIGRDYWWYQMLADKGYIVACVDGRGTGKRGEAFKKCTYKQLGKLESDDQIAAAKYFGTLPYVDKNRIGIWGWSYGGFMSSICICKGADVFKSAIAVAPVTNWRYYDNIYTERFMQKPQDNASGYDDNSPVNMVKNLSGNYLLVHGSADDNVHYQNAMEMIAALIKAGKTFDSEVYPDANHGIPGGVNRLHLYKRLTTFIEEKL
jgi:dipeptidyl-peptidase 4